MSAQRGGYVIDRVVVYTGATEEVGKTLFERQFSSSYTNSLLELKAMTPLLQALGKSYNRSISGGIHEVGISSRAEYRFP